MSPQHNPKSWIVYVSTFPPRECGIATFTQDLVNSFDDTYKPREEAKVVAMNLDETSHYIYDHKRVIYRIPQPTEQRYAEAAQYINALEHAALVHVQHEFGIYGGSRGAHVILLLRELKKPAVITFHTVLPSPDPELRDTVAAIDNHVQKIIVMTETSKKILVSEYAIAPEKIAVIPHGIHPVDFSDGSKVRKELGLSKRTVISTFGLLSRGKGIEYGIEAMVEVVKKDPSAVYLIIGATHPVVLKEEGETYRNSLIRKVYDLGLQGHVFFFDKYLKVEELLRFLDASHIYLALSQDPNQAVSGTLSYALGSGRAVVSTPFAQAKEDVTGDTGILVDFKDVGAIAKALIELATDPERRALMGKSAYFKTRGRTWPNVVLAHMNEYMRLAAALGDKEKNLPEIKLSHMSAMTDDFGMIQFAKLLEPDISSGYTIDDNARALVAMVRYYEITGRKKALPLIQTYVNFIEHVQKEGGGFHNYVNADKSIPHDQHQRENLESASTRGMYALSVAAASPELPSQCREKAAWLFRTHMDFLSTVIAPRSISFAIKALCAWSRVHPQHDTRHSVTKLADKLISMYDSTVSADWKWFEDILAYSNATMPNSLIEAYVLTKNERYLSVARESLDFLIQHSFEGSVCVPVGHNGWLKRGSKKVMHDQQPEEVSSLVSALKAMHAVTHDERYAQRMRNAFDWFLGNNLLRRVVYDQASGGCYDGLGEKDVNLNQGAESTIMYLLARLEFEQPEHETVKKEPVQA